MHIRDYFYWIQNLLNQISSISIQNITFDERSEFIGYITGQITFVDSSRLYLSEYIDVEHTVDKIKYSYHLMRGNQVLFRYDNASDPHARRLKTYPHHKHTVNGKLHTVNGKLVESTTPTLEEILEEVKGLLQLWIFYQSLQCKNHFFNTISGGKEEIIMHTKIFAMTTITLITLFSLCSTSWTKVYIEKTEQTVSFDDVYDISIENDNGDIEIHAEEQSDEIAITVTTRIEAIDQDAAERYAKSINIQSSKEQDRLLLKTELPDEHPSKITAASVDYQIITPVDVALLIRNRNGYVVVEGVKGAQDIEISSGTVKLTEVVGQFKVKIVRGAIQGKILLNGASTFSTVDGSIELDILDTLAFPLTVETNRGDIKLRLPREYSAELEAQSENGHVVCEIPVTIEKRKTERMLRGILNDSGPLLKLYANNGDIKIQEIGMKHEQELDAKDEQEAPSEEILPFDPEEEPEVTGLREPPSAEVVQTPSAPSIDGILNEAVWRRATRLSEFYLADGTEPLHKFTEAYLLWDAENFYVGVKAYDSEILKISQTERDSPVWEDDDIELLIDLNPKTPQYYHIAVSPIGIVFDQQVLRQYSPKRLGSVIDQILRSSKKETDITWNSHCVVGTEIYPDFWSVEIAIPYTSLGAPPKEGAEWGFNLHRKAHRQREYIYWSPTYSDYEPRPSGWLRADASWPHFPKRFGTLHFVEKPSLEPATQIAIADIEIIGNNVINDSEILAIIGGPELLASSVTGEMFNPEEIPAIRQTLEDSGWFKNVSVTISSTDETSTLIVEVVENPSVSDVVTSVNIQGNTLFSSEQLSRYFNLKMREAIPRIGEGRIVKEQIRAKCNLIGELYHNRGYSLASADYSIADNELTITVDEGHLEAIVFVGNRWIKENQMRKLLDISPGDLYHTDISEEGILLMAARLKRKNSYFKRLEDWKLDGEHKTLSIEIEEQPLLKYRPRPLMTFNRVHGWMLGGGMELTSIYASGGRLYGRASYGFSSRKGNFQLGTEKYLFNRHRLTLGAELHKLTDTNDFELLSAEEDFFAAFLFGESFMDYFQRRGYEAWISQQFTPSTALSIRYADDEYSSLFIKNHWSLFNSDTPKRGNPRISEGRIRSITVAYTFDSRNVKQSAKRNFRTYPVPSVETQNGWLGYFSVEYAGRQLEGDFDFTLYSFRITRYNRLSGGQTVDFRIAGGFADTVLPAQRKPYLGGIGTLRGYHFKQFMGDNALLFNIEYRLRFRRSGISALVAFADSGYTWQHKADINLDDAHTSIGVGLQLGDNIRIDFAKPLDKNVGSSLILRLERMF